MIHSKTHLEWHIGRLSDSRSGHPPTGTEVTQYVFEESSTSDLLNGPVFNALDGLHNLTERNQVHLGSANFMAMLSVLARMVKIFC